MKNLIVEVKVGLIKTLKRLFMDEYEDLDDLEEFDEEYDGKYNKTPESSKKAIEKSKKRVPENRGHIDLYVDESATDMYEALHEEMNEDEYETVKKPEVKKLQKVEVGSFTLNQAKEYVAGQCEVMEEAANRIEAAMLEYSRLTERFSDIELYESAPLELKNAIADAAQRVDGLSIDRRIYKSTENKLSNSAYHRMERYEEELPKRLEFIISQENYYELVRHDMKMLEGEQLAQRLEAKRLLKRQKQVRRAALASVWCLAIVFSLFVIVMLALDDESNMIYFILVTILGGALAAGMFSMLAISQRQVKITQIKLNKAINLLNKVKIKYINVSNVLDYEYKKYHVKNSYELSRKYELYLEMKNEQQKVLQITSNLNDTQEELISSLKRIGMIDANVWLGQVKALYNKKEMVEVRHQLTAGRQKIREQIEYNEQRMDEAKNSIRKVIEFHPKYAKNVYSILDAYEKRTKA